MKIVTLLGLSSLTLSSSVWGYSTTVNEPFARPFGVSKDIKRVLVTTAPILNDDVSVSRASTPSGTKITTDGNINEKTTPTTPTKSTYDLGIGKNQPVVAFKGRITAASASTSTTSRNDEISVENVQYLMEYESVREFPSPTNNVQQVAEVILQVVKQQHGQEDLRNNNNKKKQLPKVQLQRKAEEDLLIVDSNHYYNEKDETKKEDCAATAVSQQQQQQTILQKPKHGNKMIVPISNAKLDLNTAWVEMLIHNEQMKAATAAAAAAVTV